MKVGCVKEIKKHEYRVGLTPYNVGAYCLNGHEVFIEQGAGIGSGFSDEEYIANGAKILPTAAEVWGSCDMIVKVKEPLEPEYDYMRNNQILFTYLHLAADRPLTEALLKHKVKAVAYETIKDATGGLPLLKPMSEVAGRLSIQEGAKCLESPMGGMGMLLSGVPGVKKANILILGAGVVGTSACKIAVGIGANVTIMDTNLQRLTYLDDIFGARIQTLYSQDAAIEAEIQKADLVIGSVLIPGAAAPKLIKAKYLPLMKKNSVIVDVAVDQGGCCETTKATYHDNPTFVVNDVIHYCVANMPGAVPITSTNALTNATLKYGIMIANNGVEKAAIMDSGIASGINCYDGKLIFKAVADEFKLPHTPLAEILNN